MAAPTALGQGGDEALELRAGSQSHALSMMPPAAMETVWRRKLSDLNALGTKARLRGGKVRLDWNWGGKLGLGLGKEKEAGSGEGTTLYMTVLIRYIARRYAY